MVKLYFIRFIFSKTTKNNWKMFFFRFNATCIMQAKPRRWWRRMQNYCWTRLFLMESEFTLRYDFIVFLWIFATTTTTFVGSTTMIRGVFIRFLLIFYSRSNICSGACVNELWVTCKHHTTINHHLIILFI